MARNKRYYNQKTHTVVVGDRTLQDFAEGDSISWEPLNADKVTVVEGFDGARLSFSSSRAGKITVKLKPTSPDVGWLTAQVRLNSTDNPPVFNVTINTGVKERHSLINAGILKAGGATGGPSMTEREFTFVGEDLMEDESE